jgi:hypothetical protein
MIDEFFRRVTPYPEMNSKLKSIDIDLTKTNNPDDTLAEINKIKHLWFGAFYCVWNINHAPINYSPDYPEIDVHHVSMDDDEIYDLRWTIEYVNDFVNSKEYKSFKLSKELQKDLNKNNTKNREFYKA